MLESFPAIKFPRPKTPRHKIPLTSLAAFLTLKQRYITFLSGFIISVHIKMRRQVYEGRQRRFRL
jgi:hypothetical protein